MKRLWGGEIDVETLIWAKGMSDWKVVGDLTPLKKVLEGRLEIVKIDGETISRLKLVEAADPSRTYSASSADNAADFRCQKLAIQIDIFFLY